MNLRLRGLLISGIVLGSLGLGGVVATASASRPGYSAQRSNLFRLIWRKPMGSYSYTAVSGGRYSKHIGTRYGWSVQTDTVVFYTDAHEEFYKKDIKKYVIYYHVKSADGQYSGWIWRKNLQAIKAPSITAARSLTVDDMDWSLAMENAGVTQAEVQMMKLFPKTIYSNSTMNASEQLLRGVSKGVFSLSKPNSPETLSAEEDVLTGYKIPFKSFKVISFTAKDPESADSVAAALTAAGYDAKTRSQFAGWHIGGQLFGSDDDDEGTNPGEGVVMLTKS